MEERLHTVPKGVKGYEKVYMRCTGWSSMPERVTPLSKVGEKAIISQLVKDLKDNFGVRVSDKLVLDREYEAARVENEYVVWGGQYAGRLAEVMGKDGSEGCEGDAGGVEAQQAECGEDHEGDGGEGEQPGGVDHDGHGQRVVLRGERGWK